MSSRTFYLKYRPALISELDNEEVAEKLTAYLKTGKVPHAFLLVGHKGTGKTSSARLIAKAINCERNLFASASVIPASPERSRGAKAGIQRKKLDSDLRQNDNDSYEPCNKCELCTSITEGNNPDVMEIDAASNTSVEDVRDLRDKVRLSPSMSRNKVYIIDEVHMISKSAFNALLKTLEEPPENTVFILATTELEKVPETIVSRCTLINFKRADAVSINKSVNRIIKGEKLKIKQDAIDEIITHATGSFRDAAKILEQAVYLSEGREITKEIVEKISGGQSADEVYELIECFTDASGAVGNGRDRSLRNDETKNAIQLIENLKENNVELRGFVKKILETLHEILLVQVGIVDDPASPLVKLGATIGAGQLKIIIEQFEKAYGEMKFSDVPELPVEMAILEIVSLVIPAKAGILKSDLDPGSFISKNNLVVRDDKKEESALNPLEIRINPGAQKQDGGDFWKNLISKVNTESKQLAGVLRSCKLKNQGETETVIETTSQFHYDRLHDIKSMALIEKCALELLQHDVRIVSVLNSK